MVIHLRLDVVDRMAAEIMRGFGAVPKRGAEVGGILTGAIQPGPVSTVQIEDFEPIPCTYTRGPSFLLTESERIVFGEACRRRSAEIVGYYRSHTRDGLALQPEDIQLLDGNFPSPAQVALLVKPFATKPSVGGFFVREKGVFPSATRLEFPFRRWEMTGEEPPRRPPMQERMRTDTEPASDEAPASSPPREPIDAASQSPQPEPPEPNGRRAPKSRTGMWLVASFVFLLLGVLLGYEASRITAPLRGASDFTLSLAVEHTGENLTIRWNPKARAVLSASSGVLEIDDGGETKRVPLDRDNLSNGNFVYRNTSGKVRFRLVVYLDSGLSLTEALEWPR